MADGDGQNSAEFKTGMFGIKLDGKDAISTLLFIAVVAHGALTFWEHKQRSDEHDNISCMLKLNMFIYTIPRGEPLDWSKMPVDLYGCVPRFLYENQRTLGH